MEEGEAMKNIDNTILDRLVLDEYPYPIASAYRRLLEEQRFDNRVRLAISVFDYSLRIISICAICQYLIQDAETFNNVELNQLLVQKLPRATMGGWAEILFKTLDAYNGERDRFFIKELYDLYWDTSKTPHQPREGVKVALRRLIQIRNDIAHRLYPKQDMEWQKLDYEVMQNLREVLSQFEFIRNYKLIRVLDHHGDEYTCVLLKGEQIASATIHLEIEDKGKVNEIYLVRKDKESLSLHPLIIPWDDQLESNGAFITINDAAIYDSFSKTSLTYIAAALGRVTKVEQSALVEKFVRILNKTVKQDRPQSRRLTWSLLREISQLISNNNFGDVRNRYHNDLYLQPQDAKQAYEDFLASDKTAFVLLGKSGVGKSTFIYSVADEHQSGDQVCSIFYNGARLDPDQPLLETINRDLQRYVKLDNKESGDGILNFLHEIARINYIDNRYVVLFIDAVNENRDAKNLLRQIDALIGSNTYHWLKVVLSSRPEAWRAMIRGVRLNENRYYTLISEDALSTDLPLPYSGFEIKILKREELPIVYEKYRQYYHLQTDYDQLSVELRQLIRDPLTLKLIADIYRGQAVSTALNPSIILEQLLQSGRLEIADVRFLEQDILPLMIADEQYSDVITAQQVNTTITKTGEALFELVHTDEMLSTGKRINQSFTNLVDAEILALLGTPLDYVISFKYESFYDFFAARQLHHYSQTRKDQLVYYQEMIERAAQKPFLHNGVKNSIATHIQDGEIELIVELCFTPLRTVQKIMIEVLSDLGREDLDRCEVILQLLLARESKPSKLEMARGFFQKSESKTDTRSRNAKNIAVQVARNLNAPWVLFYGLSRKESVLHKRSKHLFSL